MTCIYIYKNYWIRLAHCDPHAVCCSVCRGCWDKRPMFWNCTRCPKLSPLSGEVVIQCGTIWSPKGFDISRLCHSNLSRSEDHSFLESSAKKGSPAVNLLLYSLHPPTYVGKVGKVGEWHIPFAKICCIMKCLNKLSKARLLFWKHSFNNADWKSLWVIWIPYT